MVAAPDRRSAVDEDFGNLLAEAAVRDGSADADGRANRDEYREIDGLPCGGGVHTAESDHQDGGEPSCDDRSEHARGKQGDHGQENRTGDPRSLMPRELRVADRSRQIERVPSAMR